MIKTRICSKQWQFNKTGGVHREVYNYLATYINLHTSDYL